MSALLLACLLFPPFILLDAMVIEIGRKRKRERQSIILLARLVCLFARRLLLDYPPRASPLLVVVVVVVVVVVGCCSDVCVLVGLLRLCVLGEDVSQDAPCGPIPSLKFSQTDLPFHFHLLVQLFYLAASMDVCRYLRVDICARTCVRAIRVPAAQRARAGAPRPDLSGSTNECRSAGRERARRFRVCVCADSVTP